MWWETLPSFFIIIGALSLPAMGGLLANQMVLGHKYRRTRDEIYDRMNLLRDLRLTGDYYKLTGLDSLPDEPAKPAPVQVQPEFQVKNPGPFYKFT